jgi:hypothetical protein
MIAHKADQRDLLELSDLELDEATGGLDCTVQHSAHAGE